MLVKFLSILLIFLQGTKSDSSNHNSVNKELILKDHLCGFNGNHFQNQMMIDFNTLKKYNEKQKDYLNVKFKEIKILHLNWDDIKKGSSNKDHQCGLSIGVLFTSIYHISYSVGYYGGNNFDDLSKYDVFCNIQQCDLGLVFFDRKKNAEVLNNINKVHTVEHAVLMVVKSSDNKMLLGVRLYHKVNIRLGVCPYTNWVPRKGLSKFEPEDKLQNNGFFEEENGYGHIVVPFYKKNYNAKEFICGTLKQPSLPDLLIGYKLKEDNKDKKITGVINPLSEEIKCKSSDNSQYHYHFGYLETDTNYMSERIMDVLAIRNKDSNHKFYAGQKIYIYSWSSIANGLKNEHDHLRLKNPTVTEEVSCIKSLKNDVRANILPTIGSVDSIKRHQKKNIFYRLMKLDDLDKIHTFRCLSKVEGMNQVHMDKFYSRSAIFSIKNEEKPNIIYTLTKNKIIFSRKNMDSYGSYRCKESNVTKVFNRNAITMDKVYYLPDEDSELALGDLKNNNKQYIGCVKQYESLGEIKKIRIEFGENVRKPIDIDNFSNVTDKMDIKENIISYKAPRDVPGVIVKCTYRTPADTTFYTKRQIHFHIRRVTGTKSLTIQNSNSDMIVNQHVNNSALWIAVIVFIVVLFCVTMITIAHSIVKRKIGKRKAYNGLSSSSSSSESSTLSEVNYNGSNGMKDIKKTTTGQSKNVAGNLNSTNLGKNHFKNVKCAAK
uniref:EGF-like domain-containing protein n=1 Tax=Strongyloides papillosus TaxID=174720 RepID=A0A0N5CAB2_STREA